MDVYRRMGLIFIFSSLAASGFFSITVPIPTGPWVGMYGSFWAVWIAVGLTLGLLLVLIQYSDIPWIIIFTITILSALVVVNLSRMWGVPFGIRDPYRHLYQIEAGIFSFEQNVYPLFHIFFRTLSSVTGLSAMTVLGTVSLIASTVGTGLLALSLRRLGLDKRVQQTAVVTGVPIVSAGLVARPYTLGIVFILAFIWIVTTDIRRRSIQIILGILTFGVLWLHPVAFLVGTSVVVTAIVLGVVLQRYPLSGFQPPPAGWWIRKSFAVIIVLSFVIHVFLFTGVGGTVLDQAVEQSSDIASPDSGQPNSDRSDTDSNSNTDTPSVSSDSDTVTRENTPLLIQIQTNFSEFIRRASLGLLLFVVAVVIALRELVSKELHYLTTAIGLSGAALLVLFVFIDIFQLQLFSGRRILAFAPIMLFPVLARLLQTSSGVRIALAVLVLTSGLGVMYTSPAIGGLQNGATSAQVDGYKWYHDYGSSPVTGTGSTSWIALGLYGPEEMVKWANGTWGLSRWNQRDSLYPWQVTDRPDHVVAINDYERARSRYRTIEEGEIQPVIDLKKFQVTNNRFYDNGNLRFYRLPQTAARASVIQR